MSNRIIFSGLIPTAFERVIQNNTTAVAFNSTTLAAAGSFLRFSVETNDVRWRDDGTDPTATTGVLLQKDTVFEMVGYNGTSKLKFFKAAGGTSVINVTRYKYDGEGVT